MALTKTPTRGVNSSTHERIEEERAAAFPNPVEVRTFRDYARGRQRNTLTREQNKYLKGSQILLCENVLKRVLIVLADRIRVTGYQVADSATETYLKDVWVRNWLSALYAQVVYATWRDGNAGASLDWSSASGRPIVTRERWYDGTSGAFQAYDDQGEPTYAVKEWPTAGGEKRRTVWFPEKIERYVLGKDGWQWFTDNKQPKGAAIPWVNASGAPLGIPFVHFARVVEPADSSLDNRDNERDGNYGTSLYAGGLLGLQDCVNELSKLILAASRFTAFQIPTAKGITLQDDPNRPGQKLSIKVEPGIALTSESESADFGFIPAGDLGQLLKALENYLRAIAAGAQVPEHTIRGQWPSGEALMRSEMQLIGAAHNAAAALGPPFASIAHKCVVLANHFGGQSYDASTLVTTQFEAPERYDPLTLTNLATSRAQYVSLNEVHRLMGYSPERSRQIIREMKTEASFRTPADPGANDQAAAEADASLFDEADNEDALAA